MGAGVLYLVSTPIGNLEDITLRALRVLKECDFIAAEDTRHTQILLNHYSIHNKLISFYSYNSVRKKDKIINYLKEGKKIALVSDAGTPGISDPGEILTRECIKEGVKVEPVPGPAALICALVVSGKPTAKFVFEGFLPVKPGKRRRRLQELAGEKRTAIIYESPHRLRKFLDEAFDTLGDREISVSRELTKKFEETLRGRVSELKKHFEKTEPRGEFVIVI